MPERCARATSTWRLGARVAISVPSENNDIAQMKIGRVFILCSKKPVTGMTTDIVRRNAVVSHCTAPAVTCRSCMSRGMATAMSVSLRMTTKVATSSRLMTSRLRPALSVTAGVTVLFKGAHAESPRKSQALSAPHWPEAGGKHTTRCRLLGVDGCVCASVEPPEMRPHRLSATRSSLDLGKREPRHE